MPLVKSPSNKAFKKNLKTEMAHGKPQKQALAIAYSTKRANMSKGGKLNRVSKHGSSGQMNQSMEVQPGGASSKKNRSGSMSMNNQSPETYYRGGMTDDSREQHNSDCPDCMAEGGLCMAHGGPVSPEQAAGGPLASHAETKDLYPHRANHAEGGMVDDMHSILPDMEKHMDKYQGADDGPASHRPTKDQYAEGGEVDEMRSLEQNPEDGNEKLHPEMEDTSDEENIRPELRSYGESSEEASDLERDMPRASEDLDLVGDIMLDRKRRMMARGGSVESYEDDHVSSHVGSLHGPIDPPTDSDLTHDEDELDAPYHDGRYQRGLNAEPVHSMEDEEHDVSDASLVAQILRDRKNRRR